MRVVLPGMKLAANSSMLRVRGRVVDQHAIDAARELVAQDARRQRQIFVHELAGRGAQALLLHVLPQAAQILDVLADLLDRWRPAPRCARCSRPSISSGIASATSALSRARSASSSMRADTPMPSPRGMYTMSRDGSATKVVRRAPLVPIGSFTTCTRMSSPSFTRLRMSSTLGAAPISVLSGLGVRDVRGVQERGALEPDVDERRLHAGQHALHAALVEIADDAAPALPLDEQLRQHAVFDERRAVLARRHVDENFRRHSAPQLRQRAIPDRHARCAQQLPPFRTAAGPSRRCSCRRCSITNTAPRPWIAYAPALPCGSPLAQ